MVEPEPSRLTQALDGLSPKAKPPGSARILNAWITQAQDALGVAGSRVGWLVAATVVSAALQRAVDAKGSPLFLLKGGTMLQYRLPGISRATQVVDGLILSLIHISEPTRLRRISYAVFCLKKKKKQKKKIKQKTRKTTQ